MREGGRYLPITRAEDFAEDFFVVSLADNLSHSIERARPLFRQNPANAASAMRRARLREITRPAQAIGMAGIDASDQYRWVRLNRSRAPRIASARGLDSPRLFRHESGPPSLRASPDVRQVDLV